MIQYKTPNICVFESALFQTTSTVIITDDLILVADPNFLPGEIKKIHNFVDLVKGDKPLYLLFTHSDYDHIIACKAFPEAKVIASKAFADNEQKEHILEEIRKFDDDYYIERDYPIAYPAVDIQVGEELQAFTLGSTRLSFWPAPGHNKDGIFTIIEPLNAWVAGDYLCNVEFPYIYHSSYEYQRTLEKAAKIIKDRQPAILIPGHGDITTSAREMQRRMKEANSYIDELRESIMSGKGYPSEKLWGKYKFRRSMEKFHLENIRLMKLELE